MKGLLNGHRSRDGEGGEARGCPIGWICFGALSRPRSLLAGGHSPCGALSGWRDLARGTGSSAQVLVSGSLSVGQLAGSRGRLCAAAWCEGLSLGVPGCRDEAEHPPS